MADEKLYEQKLTKALAEAYIAADNMRKFSDLIPKMQGAKAAICRRISNLIHISTTQAEAYINLGNGTFRAGKYMSYCIDEELKKAFAKLEAVITELNKLPNFSSQAEANDIAKQKLNEAKKLREEMVKLFGETKTKEIGARVKAAAQKQTGVVL